MDFTVVIPAFNDESTICRAIRSALDEDATTSVVVVDDGSTDSTVAAVRSLGEARVRVVEQTNSGPGAARNAGAALAEGSHLVFLDADDILLRGALDRFAASGPRPMLVRSGATKVAPDGKESTVLAVEDDHPYPRGSPLAGAFAIERRLFADIGGYDPEFRFGENSELLFRAQHRMQTEGHPVVFVPVPTVRYHVAAGRSPQYRERKLAAARRMVDRHGAVLRSDPVTLQSHHAIAAELLRASGDRVGAVVHAGRAARARPASLRAWGRIVWVLLPLRRRPGSPSGIPT